MTNSGPIATIRMRATSKSLKRSRLDDRPMLLCCSSWIVLSLILATFQLDDYADILIQLILCGFLDGYLFIGSDCINSRVLFVSHESNSNTHSEAVTITVIFYASVRIICP